MTFVPIFVLFVCMCTHIHTHAHTHARAHTHIHTVCMVIHCVKCSDLNYSGKLFNQDDHGNLERSWKLIFKNTGLENLENVCYFTCPWKIRGKCYFRNLVIKTVSNLCY